VAMIANLDYNIRIPVLPRLYRPSRNFQNDAVADLSPGRFMLYRKKSAHVSVAGVRSTYKVIVPTEINIFAFPVLIVLGTKLSIY
jgi:hypothetical protein